MTQFSQQQIGAECSDWDKRALFSFEFKLTQLFSTFIFNHEVVKEYFLIFINPTIRIARIDGAFHDHME